MYLTESDYEEMTAERDGLAIILDAMRKTNIPDLPKFEHYTKTYQRYEARYEELCNDLEEYDCENRKRSA